MKRYDHKQIEKKWQKDWDKKKAYKIADKVKRPYSAKATKGKEENFYLLIEFPYPSGNLHVGHWYAFSVPDILARTMRMQGKNVLYPIGFDAFGLPAENAAIKNKLNPRKWTLDNIEYMRKQMQSMGTSFDWSREVITCAPEYYKWTQWQFLQFFKNNLAYRKNTPVNWCPSCKTVLANEQVVDGKCERCGAEVIQREMLQWNLRITDYADRLIDDLKPLNWPEQIKESQRNWIGRSEGAEIDFPLNIGKKQKYVLLHGLKGFTSEANKKRFAWLKRELEKMGHEVVIPELPNPTEPTEIEQVEAALKATTYDENTVVCGHSLGGVVAMKVLQRLSHPIARLVLVGGFCDSNFKDRDTRQRRYVSKFDWKFDAEKIRSNTGSITILHDPKDYAISNEQAEALSELLKTPVTLGRSNMPHFNGDTEPDVLMWLRPTIRVFTTRADTLFGGTYLVLAPEHPWVKMALQQRGLLKNEDEIYRYIGISAKKTELERQTDQKEKTGVELKGVKAINPATREPIPVWIADYALAHYGTGAVMGVPAHDGRDFVFATKFKLSIKEVIEPTIFRTSGKDAVKQGMPFTERSSILAFVKHWSEDKYLAIKYKPTDVGECVSGGIEEGETAVQAAEREIREETGYTNAEFVRQLGGRIHSKYFSVARNKNIHSHFLPLLFRLRDGSQLAVSPEEKMNHDVSWLNKEQFSVFINRPDIVIGWSRVNHGKAYEGEGIVVNSNGFDGMTTEEARRAITEKFGRKKTTYKLRDWIVSRQRYWGVPIPVIHCAKCGPVPVPDKDLPVKLPEIKDYLPDGSGKSPLAKATKWVNVKCPQCKGKAERETDTLDTFVDSSWYFLRYTDPKNKSKFADAKKQANWMPVDLYSGGAEHTTMHVLYSRFWHKALFDLGLVKDAEPYTRRMNRSLILGPDGQKMSKSRGNVIDPDKEVEKVGSDTVRMYLAFVGPYNEVSNYPWNPDGVVGVRRFLEKVWDYYQRQSGFSQLSPSVEKAKEVTLNKMIKKVTEDIVKLKFNTAISEMMIFVGTDGLFRERSEDQERVRSIFLRILAPFAPHLTEELWRKAGNKKSIHREKWPVFNAAKLKEDTIMIAIQVNGKTRGEVKISSDLNKEGVEKAAQDAVKDRLKGKTVLRTIVVPGRLVNFVVGEQ